MLYKWSWTAVLQLVCFTWVPPGPYLEPLGRLLEPTWRLLGASWSHLGAPWGPLGANLEPTWSLLGASWSLLGTSWAQLGCLGRLLGPTWSLLGASGTPLGPSNRAPVVFHLYCPRGCQVQQYFICSAPRAAKCNRRTLPTKLLVAGWRHMQH